MPIKTSLSHPIRVDWIVHGLPGKVGLTFAPGKHAYATYAGGRWERDLGRDLDELVQQYQMRVQVCLLEDHELTGLQIPTLIDEAGRRGVRVLRLPIPDGGVLPTLAPVDALVDDVIAETRTGANVVIHCAGGLGRAGTIGGCVLVRLGTSVTDVFDVLHRERSPRCPETEAQRDFIRRFAAAHEASASPGPA